jgi:hypothetical protein
MRSTGVDITEESKQRELLAKSGLKHLKDGEAEGSLRSVLSEEEGEYFEWEDGKWQERQYQLGEGAVALGQHTKGSGKDSFAQGFSSVASGNFSHAEGEGTVVQDGAIGAHAEGYQTVVHGEVTHEDGTTTKGDYAHAEGESTHAYGKDSHAEGYSAKSIGYASHAEGHSTQAIGALSHAEGQSTQAIGQNSHSEGAGTTALGVGSHAEGGGSRAEGTGSHAEGYQTVVHGEVTHEDGIVTTGAYGHAEGNATQVFGDFSHAEGENTQAYGRGSHAEGNGTIANGQWSHAAGSGTTASGLNSHAEGGGTTAGGAQSHAEGGGSRAVGDNSHAEGSGTTASGAQSHSEGGGTTAGGAQSHAEGGGSRALGDSSHAEGNGTTASGVASHAEGSGSVASGESSHAGGYGTIASHEAQTAIGKYNKDVDSLLSVGNGEYDEATKQPIRKDAFRVERDGKIYILNEEGNEVLLQGLVFEDKAESVFVSGGDKEYGSFLTIVLDDIDGDTSEEFNASFERHLGESILLYVSSTTSSSEDSGNLANQGSYALVNLKFSPMENGTYAWIPEMLLRNGMRNGDVRVSGGDVSEYAVGLGSSVEGSVMTVRLLANNTSNCTLIWRTGDAVPIADKSSFYYKSITTGYVHAAKWAKEDCCLEADSHLLGNEDFYACGFSAAENEDDGGNLDYLYLFPENQSKYTAYQHVSSFGGCPVDDLTDFRVTVSKISASNKPSGNRITNGLVYEVEQEVVGLVAGEEVKFTRTGSVDLTNGNSCTWRPWKRFVLAALNAGSDEEVLVLTQENLNNYYDADTEILQVPAGTKTILFNLPDTKVAAIQMEGVTSGQRITVAGAFIPSEHYSADKNVDGRFSSYLYTYRSGYNMGSNDGRLVDAFEDFMYYYGVWYSKGY